MPVQTTRRDLLKGITLGAGATLLSPILDQVAARASGEARTSRRVVIVTQTNGFSPRHLVPSGVEWRNPNGRSASARLTEVSLADKNLHAALEPLTLFKNRLALVQGLSSRIALGGHSTNQGCLGAYPANRGPLGPTIDHLLAQAVPSVFNHVALGMSGAGLLNYRLSASGRGQATPVICTPELGFRTLFGSVAAGQGQRDFDHRSNLLDFMADDVRRSRNALAGEERQHLDNYLAAFEALHRRQNEIAGMRDQLRRHAPNLGNRLTTTVTSTILEAQFETGAAALIAGLTNVLLLSSGGGEQNFGRFPEFGINDLHAIGHGQSVGNRTYEDCFVELRQFHCRLIAGLATRLQNMREGNGTMLDNTVIVYLSDSADGHHPSCYQWPVVLMGNLGGRLRTGGRFIDYPAYGNAGHRTLANLYCTLLHAAGRPRDRFGVTDPGLRDLDQSGPLQELLPA
ncbi:MAG: DUF1552 domain-containing protein [Planctomycetes bacterium]|nr:DUF1552 domain-containing protein [Planctomycetota bacterium]